MFPPTFDYAQFIRYVDTVIGGLTTVITIQTVIFQVICIARDVIACWLQVAKDDFGDRCIGGHDVPHTVRHGQQVAAENLGGMTFLQG